MAIRDRTHSTATLYTLFRKHNSETLSLVAWKLCRGTGWVGLGWDGMGWDGMGWDGMGWDGMGWDGMGWDERARLPEGLAGDFSEHIPPPPPSQ